MADKYPLLKINDLSIEFALGRGTLEATRAVNFEVGGHETVVLAGESGSGKTITALGITRILPGSARITSGQVLFENTDLLSVPSRTLSAIRGARIAYIFQDPVSCLNPLFTIGAQITEPIIYHRSIPKIKARKEALALLEQVQLQDPPRIMESYPHQLSGGMNQRACIAMSLACRPKLLIADEPTTALDVTIEAAVLKLLTNLQKTFGFSMLFITHNLSIAKKIAQRVVVMYRGQIVESGTTEQVFAQPLHTHTRQLIAAYEKIGKL